METNQPRFHEALIHLAKVWILLFSLQLWVNMQGIPSLPLLLGPLWPKVVALNEKSNGKIQQIQKLNMEMLFSNIKQSGGWCWLEPCMWSVQVTNLKRDFFKLYKKKKKRKIWPCRKWSVCCHCFFCFFFKCRVFNLFKNKKTTDFRVCLFQLKTNLLFILFNYSEKSFK